MPRLGLRQHHGSLGVRHQLAVVQPTDGEQHSRCIRTAGALDSYQRQAVMGAAAPLPTAWEAPRALARALTDEMCLRAIALTSTLPTHLHIPHILLKCLVVRANISARTILLVDRQDQFETFPEA